MIDADIDSVDQQEAECLVGESSTEVPEKLVSRIFDSYGIDDPESPIAESLREKITFFFKLGSKLDRKELAQLIEYMFNSYQSELMLKHVRDELYK